MNQDIYTSLNFHLQSILNAKINPLTTAARTALSLGVADEGLAVFDIDLKNSRTPRNHRRKSVEFQWLFRRRKSRKRRMSTQYSQTRPVLIMLFPRK